MTALNLAFSDIPLDVVVFYSFHYTTSNGMLCFLVVNYAVRIASQSMQLLTHYTFVCTTTFTLSSSCNLKFPVVLTSPFKGTYQCYLADPQPPNKDPNQSHHQSHLISAH